MKYVYFDKDSSVEYDGNAGDDTEQYTEVGDDTEQFEKGHNISEQSDENNKDYWNKTLMMTRWLKLMKIKKILLGNLTTRTMKEWFLYRRMPYATCKTRQGFPPAGCYLAVSLLWTFSVMRRCCLTLMMQSGTWFCSAKHVLHQIKVTQRDMVPDGPILMVMPISYL